MNIYLVQEIDNSFGTKSDISVAHVVIAENEELARKLASKEALDESAEVWLDPTKTSCEVINGTRRVIMSEYFTPTA